MEFARPTLYSSKCLGFDACWWNGQMMHSDFIEAVRPFVDFVTHCPEVEIGLGAPRQFVRIILEDGKRRFVQPATEKDYTTEMIVYTERVVGSLQEIDGFVLKEGSPSCSISRVRYYESPDRGARIVTEGSGFFGGAVVEKFAGTPIESDGRLRNSRIRETFLSKVFMLASLRKVESIRNLIEFHSKNKYLIMTFGQKYVTRLGRIVSNRERLPFDQVFSDYWEGMKEVMLKTPRSTSVVNVMTKIYGYFSKGLSKPERDRYLNKLESFRKGTASLASIREILKMWALRFEDSYVEDQTVFQPFPEELNSICEVQSFKREF